MKILERIFGQKKAQPELGQLYAEEAQKASMRMGRRQWAIEQAVMLDESNAGNVLGAAEKIYHYTFGEE